MLVTKLSSMLSMAKWMQKISYEQFFVHRRADFEKGYASVKMKISLLLTVSCGMSCSSFK